VTPKLKVYTDGSSAGQGGKPGGWAYVLVYDGQTLKEGRGGHPATTNNQMELTAALKGLYAATEALLALPDGTGVELCSDSQYTLGIANGSYTPQKNVGLCQSLRRIFRAMDADSRWVRGHAGNVYNERCDHLAKAAKEEVKRSR